MLCWWPISYNDYEDRDRVSILDLNQIGKELGLTDVVDFYYMDPSSNLDGGVGFITMQSGNHFMDIVRSTKDNVVEIYLGIPIGVEDVDVGNWEWECGTFADSGISIEGLGGTLDVAVDGMQGDSDLDDRWHF